MAVRLLDRERELAALDAAARRRGGQLAIVWGRRRVGKTYLLQAFAERRRTLYYAAAQQSEPVELAGFTEACRELLGTEGLPAGYVFPDWSAALDFVTAASGRRRLTVVLDEFPYLAEASRGLEGRIQRWWDQRGRASSVMLVLCGSATAYMHQIVGAQAPLHQRATLSVHVAPLDYRGAGLFVPGLAAAERAVVYGILGGTPIYLEQWDARRSRRANLTRLFGDPASPLVDAAELVLSGELREVEGAFRILQAVALGRTRLGEISDYARVAVERPVKRLTTLGILERRVPALEDPERTKRAIYRIADPYLAFWFRFIASNRTQIARGLGARLVDGLILLSLDDYMGGVFEEMARAHARRLAAEGDVPAARVDAWWSADGAHEIDIVGASGRRQVTVVGEAKWSRRPLRLQVLGDLERHAMALPATGPRVVRLLYSRSGCEASVARKPDVRCFSAEDLYR